MNGLCIQWGVVSNYYSTVTFSIAYSSASSYCGFVTTNRDRSPGSDDGANNFYRLTKQTAKVGSSSSAAGCFWMTIGY